MACVTWISQDLTAFVQEHMCRVWWLRAYANHMKYNFGHTHWRDGSYVIRCDEDTMLAQPSPEHREQSLKRNLEPHEVLQYSIEQA